VGFPAFERTAFPRLAAAVGAAGLGRGETTFEAGLEAVLDGIERRFVDPGR
jgi:Tetracyclin repressor-like, C-terminal domain